MTDEERAYIADAAGHEWDITVPRWNMSRERFIAWHVKMAEDREQHVERLKVRARELGSSIRRNR